jgi:hypothetical protein
MIPYVYCFLLLIYLQIKTFQSNNFDMTWFIATPKSNVLFDIDLIIFLARRMYVFFIVMFSH